MRVEVDVQMRSVYKVAIELRIESKRGYAAEMAVARTNWMRPIRREAKQSANCGSDMRSGAAIHRSGGRFGGSFFNGNLHVKYVHNVRRSTVEHARGRSSCLAQAGAQDLPLFARTLSECCASNVAAQSREWAEGTGGGSARAPGKPPSTQTAMPTTSSTTAATAMRRTTVPRPIPVGVMLGPAPAIATPRPNMARLAAAAAAAC